MNNVGRKFRQEEKPCLLEDDGEDADGEPEPSDDFKHFQIEFSIVG